MEHHLYLRTLRLDLIAATLELATLEVQDVASLARKLRCIPPQSWPPPLNDEASQRWSCEMLQQPEAVGWGLWYLVQREGEQPRNLIGNAGFKGKPVGGGCEIGYSLLPLYEGRGYATEAALALIGWAFIHPEVNHVSAETFPELTRSIRVMEKCGMRHIGTGKPDEGHATVRYETLREDYR